MTFSAIYVDSKFKNCSTINWLIFEYLLTSLCYDFFIVKDRLTLQSFKSIYRCADFFYITTTGKEGGFFVVVENILLFGYNTFVHAVFLIVAFKLY